MACFELGNSYEFIRLVRLGDITRPTDHGRIPRLLELACLGTVADNMTGIVTRQTAHKAFGRTIRFRYQSRDIEA